MLELQGPDASERRMPNTKGSRQTRAHAPAPDIEGMLAGDSPFGLADSKRLFGTEDAPGSWYQSMQSVVNLAVESKLIDNAPSVGRLRDPRLIRDAR